MHQFTPPLAVNKGSLSPTSSPPLFFLMITVNFKWAFYYLWTSHQYDFIIHLDTKSLSFPPYAVHSIQFSQASLVLASYVIFFSVEPSSTTNQHGQHANNLVPPLFSICYPSFVPSFTTTFFFISQYSLFLFFLFINWAHSGLVSVFSSLETNVVKIINNPHTAKN